MVLEAQALNKEIVFIDIDNTLWNFTGALYQKLIKNKYFVPAIEFWDWHFYKNYISDKEFKRIVNEIHLEQEKYEPFEYSMLFLKELRKMGFYITIVTDRINDSRYTTERWLVKNHLDFDKLIIAQNKKEFINNRVFLVVDDSPVMLSVALRKKVLCTGLEYSWNKTLKQYVPLWNNLKSLKEYVELAISGNPKKEVYL